MLLMVCRDAHRSADAPYFLYAASNTGSIAAFAQLAEYPIALLVAVSLSSDWRHPTSGIAPLWKGGVVRVAIVGAWTLGIAVIAPRLGFSGKIVFALLGRAKLSP